MSITDIYNKIKRKIQIDTSTVLLFFVIIGVGVSSFGLGHLYAVNKVSGDGQSISKKVDNNIEIIEDSINKISKTEKERVFVASKSGKLYYGINCSGANKIKEENKIYFRNREDAEKFGYVYSSSCK